MKPFVKSNILYFILLGLFAIIGGGLLFFIEKPEAILFFSENRSTYANHFFRYGTMMGEEPIYILASIAFFAFRVRHALLIVLTGIVVTLVSVGLKALFAINRPLTFFRNNGMEEMVNFVDGVDLHAAATSFPSGHAMSGFALYSLLIFLLPKKTRIVIPLFLIALIIAVSRVYLVQHFWEDVYVGSLTGALLAMGTYALDSKLKGKLERPLFRRKNKKAKARNQTP